MATPRWQTKIVNGRKIRYAITRHNGQRVVLVKRG